VDDGAAFGVEIRSAIAPITIADRSVPRPTKIRFAGMTG
jgi:hypothetical protein